MKHIIHPKCATRLLAMAVMMAAATAATAQTLNSAYFTEDFKYRHNLNPAFGNDQGYAALPVLGNIGMKMQGNMGLQDLLFQNPATGKYDRTFMHPDVSVADALDGLADNNRIVADIDLTLLSAGFRAFGGYNTIELNEKTTLGVMLPYNLLEFAKNTGNKNYEFGDIGVRAMSYAELAMGHSRQLNDDLRIGAKVKLLFGAAQANARISGMRAQLTGDEWLVSSGTVDANINMKGIKLKNKTIDYKNDAYRGTNTQTIDFGETDVEGGGLGGFGLGLDLGAVYDFKNSSNKALRPLKVSAALTDLGFISWSEGVQLVQRKGTFAFNGFHEVPVKKEDENGRPYTNTIDDQADSYADQFSDFIALSEGDRKGQTTGLAATATIGAEYALPAYEKLSFGLMGQHRFYGDYSWTEARLSANWAPLKWLDGGMSLAAGTFGVSAGWVLNIHPRGFNLFLGMDHILGKQSKEGIPLSSNASFSIGMNIAWGKAKRI